MNDPHNPGFSVIHGPRTHAYQDRVVRAYDDDPDDWRKVLGDLLHFQWGVYGHPDSPRPVSPDEAGTRHLDRQLELAGLTAPDRPRIRRVLDVGCGWGSTLRHLAQALPKCPRLDGVNVSPRQLEYCARHLDRAGVKDRTSLYLCDAADVDRLPDPDEPYDLALARGAITHFPHELFEASMPALASRVREGGLLVVSETLYSEELLTDESALSAGTDHLAVGHRKSLEYVTRVIEESGFRIRDLRVLPSPADAAHWLLDLRSNLEAHFPHGASPPLEAIREMSIGLSIALLQGQASAYSIVAVRRDGPGTSPQPSVSPGSRQSTTRGPSRPKS